MRAILISEYMRTQAVANQLKQEIMNSHYGKGGAGPEILFDNKCSCSCGLQNSWPGQFFGG